MTKYIKPYKNSTQNLPKRGEKYLLGSPDATFDSMPRQLLKFDAHRPIIGLEIGDLGGFGGVYWSRDQSINKFSIFLKDVFK